MVLLLEIGPDAPVPLSKFTTTLLPAANSDPLHNPDISHDSDRVPTIDRANAYSRRCDINPPQSATPRHVLLNALWATGSR